MNASKYSRQRFNRPTDPTREALELVGEHDLIIDASQFTGGKTCLRLNRCGNVRITRGTMRGPLGPPDPDGQCIQIINPVGPIYVGQCTLIAGAATEDMISVYGDDPDAQRLGSVLIEGCAWYGRGTSQSSTSLCLDGPYCPPTSLRGGTIAGARCGITVAGGCNHALAAPTFSGCGTNLYVERGYADDFPKAPFGPINLAGFVHEDVELDATLRPGDVRFLPFRT
jgi:hypothetical protein